MAAPPIRHILISVLCQLTVSAVSETFKELVGAIGGSVTFSLDFTVQQVDSIAWTFNETNFATVEPAVGDKQATFIVAQKRNRPRVLFQDGGYSLTFSQLKKTDSGIYSVVIHSSDSPQPLTWKYRLHVYERLSKPEVTMGLYSNKNGTCITNLICSIQEGGEDVTYSWKTLDQAANESHDGPILPISWTLGENDMTFICMARNPISSNSSSPIHARKLCEGGAADDSGFPLKLLCVLLLIPLCLLGVTMALLLSRLTKRRKDPVKSKSGEDIHQEIPNFYPCSAENTEYDTIPSTHKNPEEDPANTLYSTVQIPKMVENPHLSPRMPDTSKLCGYENII
ncbi:PREDICTED: SLAM family member 7 isoform X2 [Chinchilla lanigera]|uniref:SLAM family member 7 n=1 Tax=Chinchilla lanigera TaxID=34839 RepID=A0A8C2VYP4_CHILA|nr:PREDICTED: SLAM family member 7 isoform X2 [Chinchilla lanigera]